MRMQFTYCMEVRPWQPTSMINGPSFTEIWWGLVIWTTYIISPKDFVEKWHSHHASMHSASPWKVFWIITWPACWWGLILTHEIHTYLYLYPVCLGSNCLMWDFCFSHPCSELSPPIVLTYSSMITYAATCLATCRFTNCWSILLLYGFESPNLCVVVHHSLRSDGVSLSGPLT